MELFNEMKNRYVLSTIKMINHLQRVKKISWREFRTFLQEDGVTSEWIEYLASTEMFVLRRSYGAERRPGEYLRDDDEISMDFEAGILIRPTIMEKAWLKSALNNKFIRLFLLPSEIDYLKNAVSDAPDIALSQYQKSFALVPDQLTEEYAVNFRLLLQAIRENRYVSFVNHTPETTYDNIDVIPNKLEYSIDDETFRFVFYSEERGRPIKANVSRLGNISIGAPIEEGKLRTIKDLVEERVAPEPVMLRVYNKHNCPERAFLLFAGYDCVRKWKCDERGEYLEFEIQYHTFEKNEIIELILTLGPNAYLVAPESIRGEIIERLRGV
jgi:hypothetical protein